MTTNFNLRLDESLKAQSFGVIESFGLTPSQFMRLILKQVADTGSLPLSFEKRVAENHSVQGQNFNNVHQLSENGKRLVAESLADIEQGRYTHHSADELIHQLADIAHG